MELPNRLSRKVEHIDSQLYRCVDEYEDFTIEALGTTKELAIKNATTDELIKEAQDYRCGGYTVEVTPEDIESIKQALRS